MEVGAVCQRSRCGPPGVDVPVRRFLRYCCEGLAGRETLSYTGALKEADKELGVLFG